MKVMQIHQFGEPEQLCYEDIPEPAITPGEVLVRVYAAGVNPIDCKTRRGAGIAPTLKAMPFIPGWDISGVVESVGEKVSEFAPGDEIFGMMNFPSPGNAYAEYVTASPGLLVGKPAGIDHVHAAATPLAALTAWQALFDILKLEKADRILVHAAAGGVGHFAVQMAARKGAHVIATASARNHEFLRSLGALECIDYQQHIFEDIVDQVDAVFDGMGGDISRRSLPLIRSGGRMVVLPTPVDQAFIDEARNVGVDCQWVLVKPDKTQLQIISNHLESGELSVHVSSVFPLDQAALAHSQIEAGHTVGKIALKIR